MIFCFHNNLNLEMQMDEISKFGKLQLEYLYGLESIEPINFEITTEFSGHLNFQTLIFAQTFNNINFEFVKVQIDNDKLNYEYKSVFETNDSLSLESYTEIWKDYNLNNEYYIDKTDRKLNFEYKNVYMEDYNFNVEIDVNELWKNYSVNFETNAYEIWKDYNNNFEFKNIVR